MIFPGDGSIPGGLANKGQNLEFYHLVSDTSVAFRAFLTAFEDQFESEWNEEQAFGRMDPISTFKRTGRKINLGWKVVAESSDHAKENLLRVSKLLQMLYPSYNLGAGISSTHLSGPPLLRLKFANLIKSVTFASAGGSEARHSGLLGYVKGFNNAPIIDDGFIEDVGGKLYPKTIQLNCVFTVLHTHDNGWRDGYFRGGPEFPYGDPDTATAATALRGLGDALTDLLPPTGPWAGLLGPDDCDPDCVTAGPPEDEARIDEIENPLHPNYYDTRPWTSGRD